MPVTIEPATADRFEDVRTLLGPRDPTAPACWCLSMRLSSADPRLKGGGKRPGVVRELCGGAIPPGVLAYVDGEAAGWCSVSPRSAYHRLVKSRVIPHADDLPVWSVVCFVVRPGFRRKGVADALLAGAVGFAQDHGASVLEGYPADTGGARIHGSAAYVGTRTMFERHGFVKVMDTRAKSGGKPRVLMRRPLAP